MDIPVKRGTFIEYRSGMLNISPIGRNCTKKERDYFELYDSKHNLRKCSRLYVQIRMLKTISFLVFRKKILA